MPEPLPQDHLSVLTAVSEAGRTGGNPTKLARASVSHLNDDDYEDLVIELIDSDMIMGSKPARGSSAARYPTGITPKGRAALRGDVPEGEAGDEAAAPADAPPTA